MTAFAISVQSAEDGDGDGEGVQRAGGAFPDCDWRHEGNMKAYLFFFLSFVNLLLIPICHITSSLDT